MMWNYHCYSYGGGLSSIISFLISFLVIVIIVKIIMRIVRKNGSLPGIPKGTTSAESLLKERFVKGEISKEEYQEKLKIIRE